MFDDVVALASGNTDSRTANARISATHKRDAWEHSFMLGGLYVRSEGDTTARRWEAGTQSRFEFHQRNFWYGAWRYEEDRFSGFDWQGVVAAGYGRRLLETDTMTWDAEAGPGYRVSRIADADITYVGDGVLADKQKQGLVSRVLSWLGLL